MADDLRAAGVRPQAAEVVGGAAVTTQARLRPQVWQHPTWRQVLALAVFALMFGLIRAMDRI
jgi:hypothetical protein